MTDLDPGLFGLPAELEHQVVQDDLIAVVDPAARYACPAARREAFASWVSAGRPFPPPAGLLSAVAGAALNLGRRR